MKDGHILTSADKIEKLRNEFREMDLDSDGILTIAELSYHLDRKSVNLIGRKSL